MTDNRVIAAVQATDEVSIRRPSFWQLADDIQAYSETLALVELQLAEANGEDRPLLVAEQTEIQLRLEKLAAELITKTDSLAGVLRRLPRDVAEYKAERDRMAAKANAAERGLKWLKEYTARVMRVSGWKNLKTEKNTIALRGNGGVQPLEIIDKAAVPSEYRDVVIRMPLTLWWAIGEVFGALKLIDADPISDEPNNARIREALRTPCEVCAPPHDGDRAVEDLADCPFCHGSGTQQVPGARLLPRGEHIEVR